MRLLLRFCVRAYLCARASLPARVCAYVCAYVPRCRHANFIVFDEKEQHSALPLHLENQLPFSRIHTLQCTLTFHAPHLFLCAHAAVRPRLFSFSGGGRRLPLGCRRASERVDDATVECAGCNKAPPLLLPTHSAGKRAATRQKTELTELTVLLREPVRRRRRGATPSHSDALAV